MRGFGWVLAVAGVVGCSDDGVAAGGSEDGSTSGTTATTVVTTAQTTMMTNGLDSSDGPNDDTAGTTMAVDSTASDTTTGVTDDDGTTDDTGTGTTGGELPPFDAMCDEGGSSSGSGGSTDTGGSSDGGSSGTGGGAPNGSACTDDDECASGQCYFVPILGGTCGECNEDADCPDGGCTLPNPLGGTWAVCNEGEQGGGCESDAACCGIGDCGTVLSVPGILEASTCGQCETDADCPTIGLCQPDLDIVAFSGILECVAPDTLPDGHACTIDASGDSACASDHCVGADLMGLLTIGVCSECENDSDCAMGETCVAPEVDLMSGLVAGSCV